jgi:ferric-dicitrate binding protein FerR (iron transport regulator)
MGATLVSVIGVVVALRWSQVHSSASSSTDPAFHVASQNAIKLREGSEITFDPAKSEIRVVEESLSHVRVDVVRGRVAIRSPMTELSRSAPESSR